jgi:hypothetical protein
VRVQCTVYPVAGVSDSQPHTVDSHHRQDPSAAGETPHKAADGSPAFDASRCSFGLPGPWVYNQIQQTRKTSVCRWGQWLTTRRLHTQLVLYTASAVWSVSCPVKVFNTAFPCVFYRLFLGWCSRKSVMQHTTCSPTTDLSPPSEDRPSRHRPH